MKPNYFSTLFVFLKNSRRICIMGKIEEENQMKPFSENKRILTNPLDYILTLTNENSQRLHYQGCPISNQFYGFGWVVLVNIFVERFFARISKM